MTEQLEARSTFEDDTIMLTNDDATSCKVSAISKGYWRDPYYPLFAQIQGLEQRFELRKSPDINLGYYARVVSIRAIILAFIRKYSGKCNVVSVGCGFDTLPFWLAERNALPSALVEVDLPLTVLRKLKAIRAFPELSQFLPELASTSASRNSSFRRPSSVILDATKPSDLPRLLPPSVQATSNRSASSSSSSQPSTSVRLVQSRSTLSSKSSASKLQPMLSPSRASSQTLSSGNTKSSSSSNSLRQSSTIEDAHLQLVCRRTLESTSKSAQDNEAVVANACAYHLVSCDVRSRADLKAKLQSCELDDTLPTLVIAECVLVYLSKEQGDEVLQVMVDTFRRLQVLVFEQCNLSSRFGQIMSDSLAKRGWHLLGKQVCMSAKAQMERMAKAGLQSVRCDLMWTALKTLKQVDGDRVGRLELQDEQAILEQLLSHYALAIAANQVELIDLLAALRIVSVADVIA